MEDELRHGGPGRDGPAGDGQGRQRFPPDDEQAIAWFARTSPGLGTATVWVDGHYTFR
ncbi:MAG TPA: hypothetical protein VES19_11860 [Candidatus Limnocylindrales bacterium]|nr:hypothetical protein [Candidatus Limnocylindrales bacterium]